MHQPCTGLIVLLHEIEAVELACQLSGFLTGIVHSAGCWGHSRLQRGHCASCCFFAAKAAACTQRPSAPQSEIYRQTETPGIDLPLLEGLPCHCHYVLVQEPQQHQQCQSHRSWNTHADMCCAGVTTSGKPVVIDLLAPGSAPVPLAKVTADAEHRWNPSQRQLCHDDDIYHILRAARLTGSLGSPASCSASSQHFKPQAGQHGPMHTMLTFLFELPFCCDGQVCDPARMFTNAAMSCTGLLLVLSARA